MRTTLFSSSTGDIGFQIARWSNLEATAAPTATDDSSDGYEVGSVWIDNTAKIAYICTDATAGAAVWDQIGTTSSSGVVGGTQAFTKASTGATTVIAAASFDRIVTISVQVTETLANGDGAQPTFAIGQTGTANKFAATTAFTGATAGSTFSFGGTLSSGDALIVTATAGTGTTETGAITVTAQATAVG